MSNPPQEHRVYAAVIDREVIQSFAEIGVVAYEARLIAGLTTQINVNRLRNIIMKRKKSHYRTIERSRLYKSLLTNSRGAIDPLTRVFRFVPPLDILIIAYANVPVRMQIIEQRNVVFTLALCKRSADSFD